MFLPETPGGDPAGPPGSSEAPFRLVVVGGGPSATYCLERLSATVGRLGADGRLDVHVFERGGEFGAGRVHSWSQPATSFLNRITGQVAFAADESVTGAGPLRERAARPTLYEWCRRKYEETGDPDFDLRPEDWPKRYVHGLALQEMFASYVAELRAHPGVSVSLHAAEVTDVRRSGDALEAVTADGARFPADHVLLLTGHSHNRADSDPRTKRLAAFAERTRATYVPYAYPLDATLPATVSGPDSVVGCAGLGLTAIDEILHLTEGRGGVFHTDPDGRTRYRPSGREPLLVVAFSDTGLFTYARPHNHKERDPERLEHRGVFLTEEAVDRLRASVGVPARLHGSPRHQLDFERHVLPVVVLEMAYVHYATLYGPGAAAYLAACAEPAWRDFVHGRPREDDEPLLAPLRAAVREIADGLEAALAKGPEAVGERPWPVRDTLLRWIHVVHGPEAAAEAAGLVDTPGALAAALRDRTSPWLLDTTPHGNVFSWEALIDPVPAGTYRDRSSYRAAVLEFMARDHLWAAQGNLDNPHKAAADGVWRDLRGVIGRAIDHAGLTPDSHRLFLDRYMRHHNKLANGAALEVMEKMRALVEHGLLDVGTGPGARVEPDAARERFRVEGPATGSVALVDTLVDARVHAFSPHRDVLPLYRNLLAGGLVRLWRNDADDGSSFAPGGLDLTARFHPVRGDGTTEERITVLGPPSEGVMFFQLGALRPHQDHHVMQDVLTWLDDFWKSWAVRSGRPLDSARPSEVLT
ncbi:FAD/NAD(P)-binding protein [Streptomyces sp. NPDC053431]|uniref:FAD/NAD(P)-binding protein n=1 Tax=Streptomyces sp. NPDC053431 TaxID=3365703 RepID=UPI0037D70DA7